MLRPRLLLLAGCAASLLQGCTSPALFGADAFRQLQNTNGLPTYSASGSLQEWEKAGPVAAGVIQQACPAGNPVIIDGNSILTTWRNENGMPRSMQWWTVIFTCEKAIPGLTPSDD